MPIRHGDNQTICPNVNDSLWDGFIGNFMSPIARYARRGFRCDKNLLAGIRAPHAQDCSIGPSRNCDV